MSKQCFTRDTLNQYEGAINRIRRNSVALSERTQENNTNITQLIENLSAVDAAINGRKEPRRKGRKTLNAGTLIEIIQSVLGRARRPLRLTEIVVRAEQQGWITTAINKYGHVSHALRSPKFRRTDRGLYEIVR